MIPGVFHGVIFTQALRRAAQAHVDDLCAVIDGIDDALDDVAAVACAEQSAQHPHGHDLAKGCHAGNADAVVLRGGNGAGHVRAVVSDVVRDVVLGRRQRKDAVAGEIPADRVIDVAIAVIVDVVAGNFAGIPPKVVHEIRMIQIDAGVHHGHDYGGGAAGDVPGLRHPYLVHVPLGVVAGISGREAGVADIIRLGEIDDGIAREQARSEFLVLPGGNLAA